MLDDRNNLLEKDVMYCVFCFLIITGALCFSKNQSSNLDNIKKTDMDDSNTSESIAESRYDEKKQLQKHHGRTAVSCFIISLPLLFLYVLFNQTLKSYKNKSSQMHSSTKDKIRKDVSSILYRMRMACLNAKPNLRNLVAKDFDVHGPSKDI